LNLTTDSHEESRGVFATAEILVRPMSRFISKTLQGTAVTMEELLCDL